MEITKKRALKYTLLPEILPRIGTLFGTGFYYTAFLLAQIMGAVRLIPHAHPYLNAQNIGRFGIRQVFSQAFYNLEFSRKNIDQICIFFLLLTCIVLILFQIILILFTFLATPLMAASATPSPNAVTFVNWFVISNEAKQNDIALMLLDRIFGVRGIFDSCISTGDSCINHRGSPVLGTNTGTTNPYPYPIHLALHSLFRLYSTMIGIISMMIILYFITTIIGETVVSGTPFGQRFNKTWAPVRLIAFFALLAPLNLGGNNAGLNGAQLITLWTAAHGSNFATNAWIRFNEVTAREYFQPNELIARPNVSNLNGFAQFFSTVAACFIAEGLRGKEVRSYLVRDSSSPHFLEVDTGIFLDDVLEFTQTGTPHVVFGVRNPTLYSEYKGQIKPYCGEITLPMRNINEPGVELVYEWLWYFINWYIPGASRPYHTDPEFGIYNLALCTLRRNVAMIVEDCNPAEPHASISDFTQEHFVWMQNHASIIYDAIQEQINNGDYEVTENLINRGWAGAAIWYNKIAQMNGELTAAMQTRPVIRGWPLVMERVRAEQISHSPNAVGRMQFNPALPGNQIVRLDSPLDLEFARAYYQLYSIWEEAANIDNPYTASTGNAILDQISDLFGITGLFNLRHEDNANIHPLALLSSLGRAMVEAAISNIGLAAGGSIASGILSSLQIFSAGQIMLSTASGFLFTVSGFTILIGFMLGFILPFMPFVYYFFALGGWAKGIFEAMVAMPLWALAHLRIDGEGFAGPGASNGYFLLFEIFIRPILILTGLVSSIIIFGALVTVLNEIFNIMVTNVTGLDRSDSADPTQIEFYRAPLDQFFFTLIYAVVVYMIGLSCFKMIDQIPNMIMRWMGTSISTFNDQRGDTAGALSGSVYQRGQMMIGQVGGAFRDNAGRLAAIGGLR
ncbi:MAG: DotA/TraY family protein [Alphaproteobacteria bacterium]